MSIDCLDCNYNCGNPHILLFIIEWNIKLKLVSVHMELNQ